MLNEAQHASTMDLLLMNLKVYKDDQYRRKSSDNRMAYGHVIDDGSDYPSKTAILLQNEDGTIFDSAIVLADGFSSGTENSWLLLESTLYILAGKSLYRIGIPDFVVLSVSEADQSTTFTILKWQNRLYVHGEQEICCFDMEGTKRWAFLGRDIFASIDGNDTFKILDDQIFLADFAGNQYVLDLNGNQLN